jgi:glyoxylase-like metal-dependent hydrolase (beta-lactamase superfamily II)
MARKQYDSLSRIVTLGDSIEIWPGHDLGESSFSTIGKEKETNPFLKCSSFTEFLYLKEHWEEYKRARGEAM